MGRLDGEVVIVTGAAQGLGAAIADALEQEGASVARTDVVGAGIVLDVQERASVEAAVELVRGTLGPPSVLVNNAGLNRIGPSEQLEEARWSEVLDTNLTGAFRCCQVAGALMLEAGRGSIVNVASIMGMLGAAGRAAYCSSKSGLIGLTRALAVEWASRGVRVNAVCPGYVRTPMIENAIASALLSEEEICARTPEGRLAEPAEVAQAVVFLASADARFVTGQSLVVDGGYLANGSPGPATRIPLTDHSP
jgi:NAD(P)-dependent dehydrogenase (short-subunit alcohol dehydrogenase family)